MLKDNITKAYDMSHFTQCALSLSLCVWFYRYVSCLARAFQFRLGNLIILVEIK